MHVYVQGTKGMLMALDLATGKEAWRHQFASYKMPIREGPDTGKLYDLYLDMTLTTTRDVLYVQDGGGLVAALDPATGKELWNKRISQVVWNQTSVDNTYVMQVVDKGIAVIMSNGTVSIWQ
jgi:outer membrane protein assembly factor BamB